MPASSSRGIDPAPSTNRRLALISGGTSGLGLAVAHSLAETSDLILLHEKNEKAATAALDSLRSLHLGLRVTATKCPLQNLDAVPSTLQAQCDVHGRGPDIFVHSAGRLYDSLFLNSEFPRHAEMIQVHLLSGMLLSRLVLPDMYRKRRGNLIFLGSIAARFFKPGQSSYAAAKAGLEAFAKNLALEVSHRGITVNLIEPGLFDTSMNQDYLKSMHSRGESLRDKIPARKLGDPTDVGELAAFLCSNNGRYITGAAITIDGGRSLMGR